jgi:tetratricopeptide (TPR) repeat protein
MTLELNLRFPQPDRVIVEFDGEESEPHAFVSPLDETDLQEIRWYLEVYSASYTADVDDDRARRIAAQLKQWGEALFKAVFAGDAHELFSEFRRQTEPGRLVTISSAHPAILSLPWELLHTPKGAYLFNERPRISIRRNLAGTRGGRRPMRVQPKERLRLLFVVSRPTGAGFLDPRLEAQATLKALEEKGMGRVEVEFLRPATLQALVDRLEDEDLPPIDILHFDGHGVFDPDGRWQAEAKQTPLPNSLSGLKVEDAIAARGANQGYLLFEEADGGRALVSAERLGQLLHQQAIGLVVLSACQSATVAGEEALGSVAARLTQAGIPSVLAMTYSVLVTTTRELFAAFYENLVRGKGIGESLDNARRRLMMHPERGERQRGQERITLRLEDWFLPALYQAGRDVPLLSPHPLAPSPDLGEGEPDTHPSSAGSEVGGEGNNLPELQEAGFFGRSWELWQIERAFVQGTRRLTISGFGGQGKTYLAVEVGRWLQRTGMFQRVCLVDYAAFQGVDAVSLAVSTLATVLAQNLLDAAAASRALAAQPTLLILDNLETLPPEPLRELLDAAKQWSEAGKSRVLLTTRTPDFNHADYRTEGSLKHQSLPLTGLAPEDALAYFQELQKLPPAPQVDPPRREVLLHLFEQVQFHPLSIGLLARQLKTRRPAELGKQLEALVAETPDNPLLASLSLSLERLDAAAQQMLPRLGVFQGGALEPDLLAITEFTEAEWQTLRPTLEATGLLQAEWFLGVPVPYLKFHPTLAPTLWARLSAAEQGKLLVRYRQRYYEVSRYLYYEDQRNPHQARAIVRWELRNLLFAVQAALDAAEDWAVDFVNNVNRFLDNFGLRRDRDHLTQRVTQLTTEVGSPTWFLAQSNVGEQLFNAGRYREAAQVFADMLTGLGEASSYNQCVTLTLLGRCLEFQGQTAQAAQCYRQGLAVAAQLDPSDGVKHQIGALQTDLADVSAAMGDYTGAKAAYESAMAISQELGDLRGIAVKNGQLGTLALRQGDLPEAAHRYQKALTTFQCLHEPEAEAVGWHQLGMVYQEARQWQAAEQAYREAARLSEAQGNLAEAAQTWNHLAIVNQLAGNSIEAEAWYRKAIEGKRRVGDSSSLAISLNNLADLLQSQSNRLPEARQLAEEALAIKQTLDPAAAAIWKTYNILAQIAEQQNQPDQVREYHRLARQAKAAFAGTSYQLQKHGQLIAAVVAAVDYDAVRQELEAKMNEASPDWANLVAALHRILDGERDEETLWEGLDADDSMIVSAILRGIADPSTLAAVLPPEEA